MKSFLTLLTVIFVFVTAAYAVDSITIDPGHGGYDPGISGVVKEKDISLSITRKIREFLKKNRKSVYITRDVDRFLSIDERLVRANKDRADIFISIHLSGTQDFAVYTASYRKHESELTLGQYYFFASKQRNHLDKSRRLAASIESALKNEFGLNVLHREMPLPLLNSMGSAAVLIEAPSKGVDYSAELERVSYTIALGILAYEE